MYEEDYNEMMEEFDQEAELERRRWEALREPPAERWEKYRDDGAEMVKPQENALTEDAGDDWLSEIPEEAFDDADLKGRGAGSAIAKVIAGILSPTAAYRFTFQCSKILEVSDGHELDQ